MARTTAKTPANSPVEGATSPPAAFDGDAVAAAETTAEEALPDGVILAHIDARRKTGVPGSDAARCVGDGRCNRRRRSLRRSLDVGAGRRNGTSGG